LAKDPMSLLKAVQTLQLRKVAPASALNQVAAADRASARATRLHKSELVGKALRSASSSLASRGRTLRAGVARKISMVLTEPVEVMVKANVANPEEYGDCPFSQRVLLTLAQKNIPYTMKLVNIVEKPQWFLDANPEGKVPVIFYEGKWVADSDVITEIIEKERPESSLKTPEDRASVGSTFFGAAAKFLKSKDPNDDTKANLLAELNKLEEDLKKSAGPFIAGDKPTAADIALAPKLYSFKVASKEFKDFTIPPELTAVTAYLQAIESLESFQKTKPSKGALHAGWKRAIGV